MKRKTVVLASIVGPFVCAGCATWPFASRGDSDPGFAKVTVRFTAPIQPMQFARGPAEQADVLKDQSFATTESGDRTTMSSSITPDVGPYHAVLWGGPFQGADVTYTATPLSTGDYMFGLFDHQRDAVYQGWINVNSNGDDILSLLTEWRDTVREQKRWLGFETKIQGKFASRDDRDYKEFRKEIRNIDRLEDRLNKALKEEARSRRQDQREQASYVRDVEVNLFPGVNEFSHPTTLPTFSDDELATLNNSQDAHTKVVLIADYAGANEKLHRLNSLRADLKRYQEVLAEEVNRLEKRKRYYLLTDHIYHYDDEFVQNERRLQQARGMLDKTAEKIDRHRRHCLALMFVRGLFSPDETLDAFQEEQRSLERDRVVLDAQQRQFDMRINDLDPRSSRRVALQRNQQDVLAAIDRVDRDIHRLDDARTALADLRESTRVIHRHGPARMITASLFDKGMPGYIADAIERECLMTVRLQATDELQALPSGLAAHQSQRVIQADYP